MSIACNVTDSVGSGPAPSPSLNSAVNHPRFRVMNLNGVQVECEVHFPRELTFMPRFCATGQLPPSLLLAGQPRWLLRVRVSPFPASISLFCCCSVYAAWNDTFSLARPLLLRCLWASFLSLSWNFCTGRASHPGSISPGKRLTWGAFLSSHFWPTPSSPLSSLQTPGTSPRLGAPLPRPLPSFSPHLGSLDSSFLIPAR